MSIFFNESDQLVNLSGDFMPGVSRDEAILGKDSGTNVTAPAENAEKPKPEQPAKPGYYKYDMQCLNVKIHSAYSPK